MVVYLVIHVEPFCTPKLKSVLRSSFSIVNKFDKRYSQTLQNVLV